MTGRFVYRYFYHDILVQSTVAVVRIAVVITLLRHDVINA